MTSDGEADVTSQRVMVKSDGEVDLPIERFAMLPGMDDLDLAVAHLHNTIEHLPPLAQEALRDALLHIERARSLSVSSDLSALASMSPVELGTLLRTRREASGLSQRRLSELSGLSDRTIKHLEQGEQTPTLDTLRRLAGVAELELHQDIASRATSGQHRSLPNSWLLPRYDRRALKSRDASPRRNSSSSRAWTDHALPGMIRAPKTISTCAARMPSSSTSELRCRWLRSQTSSSTGPAIVRWTSMRSCRAMVIPRWLWLRAGQSHRRKALRLHLLDISLPAARHRQQPRHGAARRPRQSLKPYTATSTTSGVTRSTLPNGSASGNRRRIHVMLGSNTIMNLEPNEVTFIQDQLSLAAEGDLCVLDYQIAYAPPSEPERIQDLDPPLSKGISAHRSWMTGPLRRYADAAKIDLETSLNTRTMVEGSYEVDVFATVHPPHGPSHRNHLAFKTGRYTPAMIEKVFTDYGWTILRDKPYGPTKMASVLVMEKRAKS